MGLFDSVIDLGKNVVGDFIGSKLIEEPKASSAQDFSAQQAQISREAQKDMYKNRYQWTMEDLKKAGLNPILAAKGGVMSGSFPSVTSASGVQAAPTYGKTASSVKDWRESAYLEEKADLTFAEAFTERKRAGLVSAQEKETVKRIEEIAENIKVLAQKVNTGKAEEAEKMAKVKQLEALARNLTAQAAKLEAEAEIYKTPAGKVLKWLKEILGSVGIVLAPGFGLGRGSQYKPPKGFKPIPGLRDDYGMSKKKYWKQNNESPFKFMK